MPDVIIPTSDDVSGATPGTALVPLVTGEDEIMSQSWATMRAEAAAAATDTVPSASNIYPLLRDLLSAGANITLTDNDVAETITITGAAAGTPAAQRTREQIIDLLTQDSAGDINFSRDGSGGSSDLRGTIRADSVGLAELAATGTPSVANFLRGDNTWAVAVPPGPTTPPEKFETRSTHRAGERRQPQTQASCWPPPARSSQRTRSRVYCSGALSGLGDRHAGRGVGDRLSGVPAVRSTATVPPPKPCPRRPTTEALPALSRSNCSPGST